MSVDYEEAKEKLVKLLTLLKKMQVTDFMESNSFHSCRLFRYQMRDKTFARAYKDAFAKVYGG